MFEEISKAGQSGQANLQDQDNSGDSIKHHHHRAYMPDCILAAPPDRASSQKALTCLGAGVTGIGIRSIMSTSEGLRGRTVELQFSDSYLDNRPST